MDVFLELVLELKMMEAFEQKAVSEGVMGEKLSTLLQCAQPFQLFLQLCREQGAGGHVSY